jgi:hypothetical protein
MMWPGYRSYLARSLVTLTIPQGYSLSIAATFGMATHHFGSPGAAEAWTFAAGAVVAFLLLAVLSSRELSGAPAVLPPGLRVALNIVPFVSVLLGAGAVYLQPRPMVGFPLAGFVAAGSYVLLVSAFFRLVGGYRIEALQTSQAGREAESSTKLNGAAKQSR